MPIGIGTAALIGSGLQFGGNLLQNWQNQNQAGQQRDWNEQMWSQEKNWQKQHWKDQNQWNLDMWNRMNKYNSPIEQMARLKAAGINPHMMYMKGSPGQAGGQPRS